jgi:hypothetical protein
MESKKINQLATELTPALDDLTIIGDPTTGVSKKITLSQMASLFTGTVEEYANFAAFPLVGVADTIYIALDTNVLYRWNTGTSAYVELSPNIINSLVFSDANGFDGNISLVGSTATLTITTSLTQGSVPFIGTSGALTQDNANLFFDDTNNRLGINTNSPTTALDVFGSGIIGRINGTSTNNAFLGFASAGTNKWSVGNVQSDHRFRIYNEATTSELVSVLQTGEFGIGIANPTTKIHIDGGASALIANLDANVSVAKSISFRSDNSNRINLEVSGTESGSNAGANFFIRRYSDAGALIDTPLTITRSTGAISLSTALDGTSAIFTSSITANSFNSSSIGNANVFNSASATTGWVQIAMSNTSGSAILAIEGSAAGTTTTGSLAYATILRNYTNTALQIATNNIVRTTITSSGNIGIGNSNPSYLLDVSGVGRFTNTLIVSSATNANFTITSSSTTGFSFIDLINSGTSGRNYQIGLGGNGASSAYANNLYIDLVGVRNILTITPSGSVGIGTNNPSERLDVIGGALAAGNGTIRTGITYSSLGLIGTFTNHDLGILTNGTERFRIGNSNTRNAEIDTRGNVIQSFFNFGGTLAAGASYTTTINQVLFEYQTSYIVDAIGLYAPGGANIAAFSTAIIHFFNDGNTNSSFYSTITSTGLSITTSSNSSGVFNITVTNTAGSSMSNNNIRITKINRMN